MSQFPAVKHGLGTQKVVLPATGFIHDGNDPAFGGQLRQMTQVLGTQRAGEFQDDMLAGPNRVSDVIGRDGADEEDHGRARIVDYGLSR